MVMVMVSILSAILDKNAANRKRLAFLESQITNYKNYDH